MKNLLTVLIFCAVAAFGQTTHSVMLTWTDTANPAGTTYSVHKAVGPCASAVFTTALITGVVPKTYQETGLNPGNFAYVVRAVYQLAESANSNCALAAVLPWAPTGLDVSVAGQVASMIWVDTQNPAGTTWSVQRAVGLCSGSPTFSTIATGLTTKAYTDSTVTAGQYCFQITATTNGMQSAASGTDSAQIPAAAPTGLTVQVQ
jgi:hypothetical protein